MAEKVKAVRPGKGVVAERVLGRSVKDLVAAPLSVEDVCAIIRTCSEQERFRRLKMPGLELEFGEKTKSEACATTQPPSDPRRLATVARQAAVQEAAELTEDELEHLKVTDPVAWERVMHNNEDFEDARSR